MLSFTEQKRTHARRHRGSRESHTPTHPQTHTKHTHSHTYCTHSPTPTYIYKHHSNKAGYLPNFRSGVQTLRCYFIHRNGAALGWGHAGCVHSQPGITARHTFCQGSDWSEIGPREPELMKTMCVCVSEWVRVCM